MCFEVTSNYREGLSVGLSVGLGRGWRHPSLLMVLVFMGSPSTSRERWGIFAITFLLQLRITSWATSRNLVMSEP